MIEWILSSSVMILITAALRALLKGRISLRLQYALWALVLVRLLIPFSLTDSILSVSSLAGERLETIEAMVETPIRSPEYETARQEVLANFLREQIDPATISEEQLDQEVRQVIRDQTYSQILLEHVEAGNLPPLSDAEVETEIENHTREIYSIDPARILTTLWLAGMVLVGILFLWANAHLALGLRRTRTRLDIPHALRVYSTGTVATPCLFGALKPAIYLPEETSHDRHLSHILAHETTHYRHGDHIWSVLRCLCLALHWYNPLVWLAAVLSKKDAELACDEATIAYLGEDQRVAYGETLITMTCAKRDPRDSLLTATTMNTGKRTLKERVTMIAKHPKTAIYTLIAVILVMALAVGCTFTGSKNQTDPAVTTEPPMTTTSSEDVPEVTEASVTSFSEGEVQAVLLYVSGNLYARNETILEEELPEGYALAGTVLEVNDRREPEEEFHATHLPVGAEVYTAPDNTAIIYVKDADTGLYRRMFRADISGDWWSKKFQVNAIPGFDPIGELMSSGSMHTAQRRFDTWDTMYIAAVTCLYDSPAELDLYQFFYNGIPGVDNTLTEAETAYLRSQDVGPERDVIKLPVQEMEAILLNMFGIPLKDTDMTALAELLYWEETDCYYLLDSTRYQHSITVHSVYTHETYTDIYYCIHSDSPTPDYVLTIQSIGGGIQIVSNKWLDFTPEYNGFYPEGTGLSEDATAEIAALFEDPQSWYAMATASIFATPEEVELDKLFYNGMPGEETHLTNKEKNYLYNTWLGSEIGKLEFTRVSAGDMDDVLEEYFGVSLDHTTMRGTQNFVYWDDTDCYYEAHNDAIIQDVEVQSAFVRPGGMVDVYYTADHTGTDEYYVMTLQLRGEKFVICANWYVNESTTLFQATAAGGIQRLIIAHSVTTLFEEDLAYYNTLFQPFYEYGNGEVRPNLVCCFFTSYYDSPEELDLVEFLRYNPLSTGLTEGKDYEKICQLEGWTDFAPVPVHKFEEDDIDDALETFMGISLNDLQDRSGRNGLHYLPEYDAYYNTTSDAGFGTFTADRGETLGNTIVLYDDLGIGKAVKLTLRQEGRNLLIVSHQLIEG